MQQKIFHIIIIFFSIMFFTKSNAQVWIGDGVTISKGTSLVIKNKDVKITASEIEGEGNLVISNKSQQEIHIAKNLKSDVNFTIDSDKINLKGKGKTFFALHHLPSFSEEIILAKEQIKQKNSLPIRYINVEGKSFTTQKEKNSKVEMVNADDSFSPSLILVNTMQFKAISILADYNLPIYSFLLNNVRFSDDAELYEFECLTAILKPPTV